MTVDSMAAVAILSCQPSSHPFNERQIALHEPVKVGRSVARARPAPNNAIFDCKVLSRNHAMVWYDTGKFFLQDTKSSNGTFVNHQRLSKGSEESPPREVFSGDIIQFGVDVMENSRRDEGHFVTVTHGCIIATITLYHPDGSEAKPNYAPNGVTGASGTSLTAHSHELYQLAQYLQEALHREQLLENKLATLQRLVATTQDASESGWQALIDEDRLLSRLEVLEAQLQAYAKNQTEDKLREELVALQEDKHNYETTAKESLRRIMEEKLEAVGKLSDLEQSLGNTADECTHLKEMFELSQKELEQLAETHQETLQDLEELKEKLKAAQSDHEKEIESVKEEKEGIQVKLEAMVDQETELTKKVHSLQSQAEERKEEMDAMKEEIEQKKLITDNRLTEKTSQEVQVDLVTEKGERDLNEDEQPESLKKRLRETQEQIETYRTQIKDAESRLEESQSKVDQLQVDLNKAEEETRRHISKLTSIEAQLNESRTQADSNSELSLKLRCQIEELEVQLSQYQKGSSNVTIMSTSDDTNSNLVQTNNTANQTNRVDGIMTISKQAHIDELERLKNLLSEARDAHQISESEIARYKVIVEEAQSQTNRQLDENKLVQAELSASVVAVKEKDECIASLQDQLAKADLTIQDVKKQIVLLREQHEEQTRLREQADHQLHVSSSQLVEAQQTSKHSRNEAEQLRAKVKELHAELEVQKVALKDSASGSYHKVQEASTTLKSSEFSALRQECDHLKQRIMKIEADMRMSRQENHQFTNDYSRLKESYHDLEHLTERLEFECEDNLTDAQKEADQKKNVAGDAGDEQLTALNQRVTSATDEISFLQAELNEMSSEYSLLAEKTRTLSVCAMIPIIILIFSIMIAFYQPLASITATTSPD